MKMKSLFPVILTILVGVLIVRESVLGGGSKTTGPARPVASAHVQERDLAPAGLQFYWTREMNLDSKERVLRMYVMDENLYCITDRNRLRAMDAAVGNPKWSVEVGNRRNRIFAPTHVLDMRLSEREGTIDDLKSPRSVTEIETFNAVVINSMTHLMVVDRKTGRVYRNTPFDGVIATQAGISNGTSFFVGTGNRMYCEFKLLPNVISWRAELGEVVTTPMGYYDRNIYMGTRDGLFRCAEVDRYGEKRWQRKFDGSLTEKFHVDTRGVFLACNDKRIYGLNPYNGEKLWPPVVVKGTVGGPIQMAEKTLFQYFTDDGLYAVNVANGDVRWKMPTGRKVLAILDGSVYVLDANKQLHQVNEITGKTEASVSLRGFDYYANNTSASGIYTATRAGQVFCIRPKSAGRLTVEQLTK